MAEIELDLNRRIAEKIGALRRDRAFSLDALAGKSGVSRSMISLVERGESSPTAAILEKLAAALGITLASLFDAPDVAEPSSSTAIARRNEQPQWRDPGSGYLRRNVSPAGVPHPMRIVEVVFPPRARVAFETGERDVRVFQQLWLLEGTMEITVGEESHRLAKGDCLAMQLDQPTMFYNPTRKSSRYAVIIFTEVSAHAPAGVRRARAKHYRTKK